MNNAMGQLAGLLSVVILPAIAGLAGVGFGDPAFAVGYGRALGAATLIAITCIPIAAWSFNVQVQGFRRKRDPRSETKRDSLGRREVKDMAFKEVHNATPTTTVEGERMSPRDLSSMS